MKGIRPLLSEKLEEILHELIAINAWDRAYVCTEEPDFIASTAWEARRRLVSELLRKLDAHCDRSSRGDTPRGNKRGIANSCLGFGSASDFRPADSARNFLRT